jgi:putative endonuclease
MVREYYFYMMASYRGALYAGVTNDLTRRAHDDKQEVVDGFTKKYNVTKLVYHEATDSIEAAIEREKQVKGWLRRKKVALIESVNPYWEDLAKEWYEEIPTAPTLRLRPQGDIRMASLRMASLTEGAR